ncbi:transcriptional regulator PpsR [Hyphomonas sp.]|uniref:transcriptional regulator PpsR n=1 Tax=Hyphomonas sp. TaxID=87 RepID=UPI003918E91F
MDASSNPKSSHLAFRNAEANFSGLDPKTIAALVESAADIALVIEDGKVRDISIASDELSKSGFGSGWVGKPWIDTVSPESRAKIEALLTRTGPDNPPRARQVNHPSGALRDVPVAYRTVHVDGKGGVIALGRDLRAASELQQRLIKAQQDLERDYAMMRQAEARYKVIFEAVSEPLLIVDGDTLRVDAANPAASEELGLPFDSLAGSDLADLFAPGALRPLERLAASAIAQGRAGPDTIPGKEIQGKAGQSFALTASTFGQGKDLRLILRLNGGRSGQAAARTSQPLLLALENLPDGLVIADRDLRIVTANRAFAEIVHVSNPAALAGARLADFIGRSQTDLNVLLSAIRTNGAARNFATVLHDRFGAEEDVEISGVVTEDAAGALYGFSIRNVARRMSADPPISEELPRSVEHLTNLVGRMPLKDIVRDSTALIERLCIEAALRLTDDNRASAAEILGLSRQGLYSKLNRFGFEDKE